MLSSIQNASPRARLLITRHALQSSSPTGTSAVTASSERPRQLSLGRWTNVGSFLHREARQRHRVIAFKCISSVHRYLSWDNNSRPEHPKAATRKVVAEWLQSDSRPNRYTNANDIKSWSDDLSGVRPGQHIEDVERGAINHLFRKQVVWSSPLPTIRDHIFAGHTPREVTAESVLRATAGRDNLNYIDPVTNRRVTPAERGGYSKMTIDDPTAPAKLTPEEESKRYKDLGDYSPTKWDEPLRPRKLTPEEESKQYKDLNKYTPKIDDPDAPRDLTPEEQSKLYEDLDKYEKPVTWNEPDGLQKPTAEEDSKQYEDLDQYEGPVRWNEPDGLQPKTPEEKSKDYEDLGKYRAFAWNEPDGLRILTPEEKSKQYDDLQSYDGPFEAGNSAIKAYEALLNDPTVKAKPLARKVEVQCALPVYPDLDKYGPVMWNEPDGLRLLTPEEKSKQYEDLPSYAQYHNADATIPRVHPEEASKRYEDLSSYSTSIADSGLGVERIHPEEASKHYKDLNEYSAFLNSAPEVERIHPEEASKEYKDLHQYASGYEEPAETEHVHPEELTKNYDDLDKYEAQSFDAVERVYPLHPEVSTKDYQDLHRYQQATPLVHDEPFQSLTAHDIRHQVLQRAGQPVQHEMLGEAEMSSMDESFPKEAKVRAEAESYSTIPQGLKIHYPEKSADEEADKVLVQQQEGATPTTTASESVDGTAAAVASAVDEEPTDYLFKILAYDPETQSVNFADTKSADHDASAPQKLSDIVLKLTHPSKFLPHFKTAQALGYDLVAGGGDVLIFRKSRPSSWVEDEWTTVATGVSEKKKPKKKRSLGRKVVLGTVWVGGVAYAVGALGEGLSAGAK